MIDLERTEYETFDYKRAGETPLTLHEAVKKAQDLRASKMDHVHRIVPLDSDSTSFMVVSMPQDLAYAERLMKWKNAINRLVNLSIKRVKS